MDHLLTLIIGIGPSIYDLNHDQSSLQILSFCKVRGYVFQVSLMISRWFVAFACVDRYASSSESVNRRHFARTRIAYRVILVIAIFWSLVCSHRLIFYEVKGKVCGILTNTPAAIFHTTYVLVGGGVLPATIMVVCAFLIRRNLARKELKRVHNVPVDDHRRTSLDQQVLRLLFIQVTSYILFTIPQMTYLVFNAVSSSIPNRSEERLAIEGFAAFIAELMLYMFPVTAFYLYTLTSRTFRGELIKLVRSIPFSACSDARIAPTVANSTSANP